MFVACDESGNNSSDKYLVIGSVWIDKKNLSEFEKRVTELRLNSKCWGEIEWLKLNAASSEHIIKFYKDFIKLAFDDLKIYFRFIIVKKDWVNLKEYHQGSKELMQLKFMYLSISRYAENCLEKDKQNNLHIVFDSFTESKTSKEEKWRIGTKDFIEKYLGCGVEHLQPCCSHICSLIQLCDLFTGAVSTSWNTPPSKISETKSDLIKYMEKLVKTNFGTITLPSEKDFNIWAWRPSLFHSAEF